MMLLSSLIKLVSGWGWGWVEVGVGVGVGVSDQELDTTYQKLDPQMKSNLTFSVGWVGGWRFGE